MTATAGFLREDSSKVVRWVNWDWAVTEVVGGVRAEREGESSGCCGGSSGGGRWRGLESLFRAIFLDIAAVLAGCAAASLWLRSPISGELKQ